ncbi:MAG: cob(I)yrinic acid a,c-diamide adenosyltransferase [Saprospiraceae bacterium]|nr:cob(I)yrinic acid a,c-diamide adenosyltransferase [Saprospiraceae bacterium]HMW40503.1 cob(I)yrinic acid a,c-diamide adenosyltransferase [Saprospiraceae bacterium]HMX88095.1 cob(I)yrinic acid a,c-diamide adenosyltransferase [Saprospiraceae bacterium]HMZ38938.1 cob(I)yrinic acid a,c-diamide adenosyltransferase [Saprospiraceae bacterium]HNA65228.1 cob(I)yrinic acid a,c-diamide adenosyltransferase [Saprospiraceae bacterium]
MKIYTKTGDLGQTSLFGGRRVSKDDLRVEAYGTVDELNAAIGLLRCTVTDQKVLADLLRIQAELFVMGSHLAADPGKPLLKMPLLTEAMITSLENHIDAMEEELQPLRHFLLPGGSEAIARTHLCRTISRRSERKVVSLSHHNQVNPLMIQYLNRLSDYFFVLSRYIAQSEGVEDIPWIPDNDSAR